MRAMRASAVAPLHSLLALSDLAREGLANHGSYRFADHLYKGEPSGRLVAGRYLDSIFLRLPAAAAFRRRYLRARDAMADVVRAQAVRGQVRILTVPCGIPRDAVDMAIEAARHSPTLLDRIEYVGMDIDPEALSVAAAFVEPGPLKKVTFHQGDALDRGQYPAGRFHMISSTGLAEFLDDAKLATLYAHLYDALEPGGTLYTSATASEPLSALLLRIIDLETHYRPQPHLESLLNQLPWRSVKYVVDPTGLQTFATAIR